jgi:hypothetical protein
MASTGRSRSKSLVMIALCSQLAATPLPAAAQDATEAERRCGRAVLAARAHVQTSGTRTLSRCAHAVLSERRAGEIEKVCRRLRTRLFGVDLADRRARKRIQDACGSERPPWITSTCIGIGPWSGRDVETAEALAGCVVGTSHCLARASIEALVGPLEASVGVESPANLAFEYGGVGGNSFDACVGTASPTTTVTTSTTVTTVTTTTVDTTSSTTALPTTTTSIPSTPTTTLLAPTTTVPVTTTLSDVPASTTTTTTSSLPVAALPRLVVTEIMLNPAALADSAGEYFEVKNLDAGPVDLAGLVVRDRGANRFTVGTSLIVAPGGYVVFVRNAAAAAGHGSYVYGSAMSLGNESDAIILELEGEVLDEVAYDVAFPLAEGRSLALAPSQESAVLNDAPSAWCASSAPLVGGDFGSPGASALDCAP